MLNQTTPVSTPLDTLKALVLRNIEHLEYISDRLGGGGFEIPEEDLDFLDMIRQQQYKALNEHVPVGIDPLLNELRRIPEAGYTYDDGTLVAERFSSKYGTSVFFTRYDGSREAAIKWHQRWTGQIESEMKADIDSDFNTIVNFESWGADDLQAND